MRRINSVYHLTEQKLHEESEWILSAQNDPKHFAPLYEKYYKQIFRYILHRVHDEDLADDITSQVFYKAIQNIKNFEYRGLPLGSWLYRIAKSELNQAFRDKAAKREVNFDNTNISTVMEVFKEEGNFFNKKKLLHALSQLNGRDLQLIELRFFEERSYREIGEILNISENNAKVRAFRTLLKLKKLFHEGQKE